MNLTKKIIIIFLLTTNYLTAHALWINTYESFSHKPGHIILGLGWGHSIPIDDILNSKNGKIVIDKFVITSPTNKVEYLKIPASKEIKPFIKNASFEIYDADFAFQQIALKKESKKGTYEILAKSKPTIYTQYIDSKNRTRLKLKPMNEIKDIKNVLMSVKYQAVAKSYFTLDKWTEQKPKNKGLEIIPKNDLSNLKVGDLVKFEVLFNGIPLTVTAKNMNYITAKSNTFGQKDGFSLLSYINNGKAQFRVQSPGKWIVSCNYKEDVKKEGKLKSLYGKVEQFFSTSTLTFNVK